MAENCVVVQRCGVNSSVPAGALATHGRARQMRAVVLVGLGLAALAALLLVQPPSSLGRAELDQEEGAGARALSSPSYWGQRTPAWWSGIPVYTGAVAEPATPGSPVRLGAALPAVPAYGVSSPEIQINGIPVEGVGNAQLKIDGIPVEGLPAALAPAFITRSAPPMFPMVAANADVKTGTHPQSWVARPHGDYVSKTQTPYVPAGLAVHHWGSKPHDDDYAHTVFKPYTPWHTLAHGWDTRKHVDFAEDVFGKGYKPDSSIPHHWGTRNHEDYAESVFKKYTPNSIMPHHWGTRNHEDFADSVFKQYTPDPAWTSHYGTRSHVDYETDVYSHKYVPDAVFPYHWGTRRHKDYEDDVFSRPFVSWDMPYGVAPPRAGGFVQDISPSENKKKLMDAGAEDTAKRLYAWRGVQETGPGGTFKSWWPPGNRQQDVMGDGGNTVPTKRGDEGPNNYRIPFKDYIAQYTSRGRQGPPPIADFPDSTPRITWKSQTATLASGGIEEKAAAQTRLRAKSHKLASREEKKENENTLVIPGSGEEHHADVSAKASMAARWLHGPSSSSDRRHRIEGQSIERLEGQSKESALVGLPVPRALLHALAQHSSHEQGSRGLWGGEWREAETAAQEEVARQQRQQQTRERRGAVSSVKWDYSAVTGPHEWGTLSQAFASCSSGHGQSPVNLGGVGSQISGPLHISSLFWEAPPPPSYAVYEGWRGGASFSMLRNGGLELKAEGTRPVLVFEGQRYALDSLQFHTPSEHTIDGVRADAELQFTVRHVEGPSAGTMAQRGRQSGTMVLSLLLAAVGGEGVGEAAAAEVQDGGFLDAILQMAARHVHCRHDICE